MPYYFSDNQQNVQPYVYFSDQARTPPFAFEVLLPQVFQKSPTASITVGPFTLEVRDPASATLPYKVAFASDSDVWKFGDAPLRTDLQKSFLEFLVKLEATGLVPGGLATVRLALAQRLPLTFTETLFYRYGFDGAAGYSDLQPGMRLRADFQGYQLADPTGSGTNQYLNGYTGSESVTFDLVGLPDAQGFATVALNAFLGRVGTTTVAPNKGGGGGMVDLWTGFQRRFLRALYPTAMDSADTRGFVGTQKNVTLVATDSLADLEAATKSYRDNNGNPGAYGVSAYLRGRTVLVPQVQVYVRGAPTYVPLGTTLRHLLDASTFVPPLAMQLPNLNHQRWLMDYSPYSDTVLQLSFPGFTPVNVWGSNYRVYWNGADVLDLPLAKGDALTFSIPDILS
ncbi:hypothetical protein D7X99_37025 [Corallococcus sp. AB032C]|uniref:hypothetical protein n=1 Tax=Corallococcus TaxID=83461 RepID=UPI000EC4C710|nr:MULTISPECIES: hypothetical protein [Corallococcus]NPC49624.1 hypothetical protein [Corallococcus exiguus]NPC73198.1 hypothetical protein [Corallococcus exiguus]RKH75802.1 hypothetical protein D7X99_37025 [Corallococcus sp. AB032C]